MSDRPNYAGGEFVKISVDREIIPFFPAEPSSVTLWYFARFIAWVDDQAVIEDARGGRALVDHHQVHDLDVVVPAKGPTS